MQLSNTINTVGNTVENLKSWRQGQSGNIHGRPKGARNFRTVFFEQMTAVWIDEDALMNHYFEQALKTPAMLDKLMDRLYWKPMNSLETEGNSRDISIWLFTGTSEQIRQISASAISLYKLFLLAWKSDEEAVKEKAIQWVEQIYSQKWREMERNRIMSVK